jgi:hypothetical protein
MLKRKRPDDRTSASTTASGAAGVPVASQDEGHEGIEQLYRQNSRLGSSAIDSLAIEFSFDPAGQVGTPELAKELLQGVLTACDTSSPSFAAGPDTVVAAAKWLAQHAAACSTMAELLAVQSPCTHPGGKESKVALVLLRRALAVAVLRHWARAANPSQVDGRKVWPLIFITLDPSLGLPTKPIRSSQGFAAIPLFSINSVRDTLDELLRLHVWLPEDMTKANPDTAIHSHQPHADSWVLSGPQLRLRDCDHQPGNNRRRRFRSSKNHGSSSEDCANQ